MRDAQAEYRVQPWEEQMSSKASRSPQDETYRALERADRLRRRRDSVRSLIVVFVVIPGIVIGAYIAARIAGVV
jgi:hypothetical protein